MEVRYPSGAINYDTSYGLVWTEPATAEYLLKRTNEFSEIGGNILEPSFGNGVFLDQLKPYSYERADGFEVHPEVFAKYHNPKCNLTNGDFLLTNIFIKYDFIIGGFPFLYLSDSFYDEEKRNFLRSKYYPIFGDELRLMNFFIHKSHSILNPGGFMAIIIHKYSIEGEGLKNFLNNSFETKLLEDIHNRPFMKMIIIEKTI